MDVDCGSAQDRLGRVLGRYRLDEIVGAGGTAVVYRATSAGGETVAVKVLHDHLRRSREVRRRFLREADIASMLDHPGIVRVLDRGKTVEGSPYLVFEHLEGESLEQRRVRAGGRLELGEVLGHCDALLSVLERAHAKSVIHRDIKPSNLLLTHEGVLKVLDFGIARRQDSPTATKTGQTVGTPAFMSPEQALSRPRDVDARTDLWSVGATVFTLLSGELVHLADGTAEHLVKAATAPARSLAIALPSAPAEVVAFVARSLAFDKRDRFPTAAAMRAELARIAGAPARSRGLSFDTPSTEFLSRANVAIDRPSVAPNRRVRRSSAPFVLGAVLVLVALDVLLGLRAPSSHDDARVELPAKLVEAPPKPVSLSATAEESTRAPSASASARPSGSAPRTKAPPKDVYKPF
jgi:serine/threonine-protein kinase